MFSPKLNKYVHGNFYPLEVVGRGSETQLQVGENLNYLTYMVPSKLGVPLDCAKQRCLLHSITGYNAMTKWRDV